MVSYDNGVTISYDIGLYKYLITTRDETNEEDNKVSTQII